MNQPDARGDTGSRMQQPNTNSSSRSNSRGDSGMSMQPVITHQSQARGDSGFHIDAQGSSLPIPVLPQFTPDPRAFLPISSGSHGSLGTISAPVAFSPNDADSARTISELQLECNSLRFTARAALQYQQDQFRVAAVNFEHNARAVSSSEMRQEESMMAQHFHQHIHLVNRAAS